MSSFNLHNHLGGDYYSQISLPGSRLGFPPEFTYMLNLNSTFLNCSPFHPSPSRPAPPMLPTPERVAAPAKALKSSLTPLSSQPESKPPASPVNSPLETHPVPQCFSPSSRPTPWLSSGLLHKLLPALPASCFCAHTCMHTHTHHTTPHTHTHTHTHTHIHRDSNLYRAVTQILDDIG